MTKRRMAGGLRIGIAAIVVLAAQVASAAELANDGYVAGGSAAFQEGFIDGEIGAVRLVPDLGPVLVERVRFLFGGGAVSRDIAVHIWDDSAEALEPGAVLYSDTHSVVGFDTAFQEINLSGESIVVAGPFRVGIEFVAAGLPSIARDDDGTIDASRNFVFVSDPGWIGAQDAGLVGDWVIRAVVVPEPDGAAAASLVVLVWLACRRRDSAQ